jgi:hypothetical protein
MANIPFDQYFTDKTAAVGQQGPTGDDYLVLRAGTVFKINQVNIKAIAYAADDSDVTTITTADVWVPPANTLVQGVTTPTLTYATNQFTYIGPNQIVQTSLKASMSCKVAPAIPGTANYDIGIFVNDLLILNSMTVEVADTGISYVGAEVQRLLVTGDVIDFRVRSRSGTLDLIVQNAQLIVG